MKEREEEFEVRNDITLMVTIYIISFKAIGTREIS